MVFLTAINFVRCRGAGTFWKRRRVFMMSAHFKGRHRNCYKLAAVDMKRALQFNRLARPLKKQDMADLWEARISAGCEEHGLPYRWFHEGLMKASIFLNRKVLADLAAWEPRTFGSLTKLAWQSVVDGGRNLNSLGPPPEGVMTKGKLH